ncbi:MAG: MFS transporter [Breznakibacter sp.]
MMVQEVNLREKIGYGLGDAASSMFWKLFGMYLLYFYTDVFGIPAVAAGTMFLITRIWDSFVDPIVGIVSDRTDTRWGKFRPFILWMAIPFAIMGLLTFTTPNFSETGKLVYAYITYGIMMMVYSMINVPYASLLGVISSNPTTRTELSSYRMIFAFAGSILALLLVEPLVSFFGGANETGGVNNPVFGWEITALVFAIIAAIMFFATFAWTKERVKPINQEKNRFADDLADLLKNRPWWILLGAGIAALIFNSIRDGAAVYYFKYYVTENKTFQFGFIDSQLSLTTIYLVLGQAANILGILFVTPISRRIGKKITYLGAMVAASIFSIAFYFVSPQNITGILLLQVLISMCAGAIFPLLWSMYADIADYSEWRTNRRATGLIFSSSSMSQKFGWTIGGAVTGWMLAYFGYEANQAQGAAALEGIRYMMSLLPAIGTILSVVCIALYPLTEKMLKQIGSDLETRRSKN